MTGNFITCEDEDINVENCVEVTGDTDICVNIGGNDHTSVDVNGNVNVCLKTKNDETCVDMACLSGKHARGWSLVNFRKLSCCN